MSGEFTERVLALVERIPPGRVLSYGVIAQILDEGGPRQVGSVMAHDGGGVPWWRVVRADGGLPPSHQGEAQEHYEAEETPLRAGGTAVDIRKALWDGPFEL
jgi:alkylated DNA nucleotide flippase Atl1